MHTYSTVFKSPRGSHIEQQVVVMTAVLKKKRKTKEEEAKKKKRADTHISDLINLQWNRIVDRIGEYRERERQNGVLGKVCVCDLLMASKKERKKLPV